MDIRSAAQALRGDIAGRNAVLCPGPGHSAKDRSLSVTFEHGNFVAYSHAGDDWKECRDHVRHCLGWGAFAPHTTNPAATVMCRQAVVAAHNDDRERTERAYTIWRQSAPISETPVQAYLAARGVSYAGDAIRWHPSCPFGRDRTGCMVALVRNIITDKPQAIHRTAISQEGRKLSSMGSNGRLALGPIGGGAIKLTGSAEVSNVLAIGEGLETALSIKQLPDLFSMPVWSVISSSGITSFPVLACIETMWIAADNDTSGTGQKAARAAADRVALHA
jgi:hypothetical protein